MKTIFWGASVLIVAISIGIFLMPAWAPRPAEPLPDSPANIIYGNMKLFGQPTIGNLDTDNDLDAAVILIDSPGGTGTFYYVAAAINTGAGYQATNEILLGDRIAPQTLEIRNGVVIANYADRKPDEPFSADPSVGTSLYAKVVNGKLVDVTATEAGK